MTAVLAVDQGTSATKAVVVDDEDGVLVVAEVGVHPRPVGNGGVEHDPAELLESVLTAGHRALAAAGRPVAGVAFANQGETVLAWDPTNGEPLGPALVWQDSRAGDVCTGLAPHAAELAARTGLVLSPYFSAPKMAWLRRHRTRAGVVTTTDAWLLHALTGELVTDVTTASRSLLLDLDLGVWDRGLAELFGLADERLPRVVGCDEVVGETAAFGGVLPVGGLLVDQQAALLAQDCRTAGQATCTYGTGAFLLAATGATAPRSAHGLTTSVASGLRGRLDYCLDAQVFAAGAAVAWFVDLGLIGAPDELDTLAGGGSGGVLCVPALGGLGAPWWRPQARASLTGMSAGTSRGHLVAALLEGIAAQVACLAQVVAADLGAPLTVLRAGGGLTRSRFLVQAQADLAQLPVEVFSSPHATAVGAAAALRLALDPGLAVEDAVGRPVPVRVVEPDLPVDRAAELLDRWRAAARASS